MKPKKKTRMKLSGNKQSKGRPSGNKQTKGRRSSKNKQTKGRRPSKNKQTKGRKKSKKLSKKYSKKSKINESEPAMGGGNLSEKEVILGNIFIKGMLMKDQGIRHELNHVIIKPLVADEAPSTVVLAAECAMKPRKHERDDGYCFHRSWSDVVKKKSVPIDKLPKVVIKIESIKSGSPQIYQEESVLRFIKQKTFLNKTKEIRFPKGDETDDEYKEKLNTIEELSDKGIPDIKSRLIIYTVPSKITDSLKYPEVKVRLIIMEKLDNSLSTLIKEKNLDINEIKYIMNEYLKILQYIHASGYIHFDIKPENLMIKGTSPDVTKNEYYIIDFGIARKWFMEKSRKKPARVLYIIRNKDVSPGTTIYRARNADHMFIQEYDFDKELEKISNDSKLEADREANYLEVLAKKASNLNRLCNSEKNIETECRVQSDVDSSVLIDEYGRAAGRYMSIKEIESSIQYFLNDESDEASLLDIIRQLKQEKLKNKYLSRNEDIESLAYVIIKMVLRDLPWKIYKDPKKETLDEQIKRIEKVLKAKEDILETVKEKITDENLKEALTLMIQGRDELPDYEPPYKDISDLLTKS